MKFVEIYKTQNDGSQRIIATCELKDDTVVCEGEKALVENLEREGITAYVEKSSERLYPKDGIRFLENLHFAFRSGYLSTSETKEK